LRVSGEEGTTQRASLKPCALAEAKSAQSMRGFLIKERIFTLRFVSPLTSLRESQGPSPLRGKRKNSLLAARAAAVLRLAHSRSERVFRTMERHMGLDCYWTKPDGPRDFTPLPFDPPLFFAEDMRAAYESRGFRGQACARLIEQIAGESLYEEWIGPDTVLRIARQLETYVAEPWKLPPTEPDDQGWEIWQPHEIADVARMFRAYGESG